MKRARLIIKEITVAKSGEIKNFQLKLPKNTTRIIAIETDVLTTVTKIVIADGDLGGTKI